MIPFLKELAVGFLAAILGGIVFAMLLLISGGAS